jgi:hypothetical protein
MRQRRAVAKLSRAVNLLHDYAQKFGQVAPNPRSSDTRYTVYVLPFASNELLREGLTEFEANTSDKQISKSTLARAIKHMRVAMNMKFNISKNKAICRCDDCSKLDNERRDAVDANDTETVNRIKAQKSAHLRQVKEQRDHFDAQKEFAVQHPRKLWCITFDGMDQAKTQLPSKKRFSKALDGLPRLGVHVVGAFCFGGLVPVLGLLNYQDLQKNSSLSVTTLEKILDIQWNRLEERRNIAAQQLLRAEAEAAPAAAASAAASASAPAGAALASEWPERLHVTFDNATGEAKNQYMFRFLGALVLAGVFTAITVSTLIVGHTHDIVDQMFSVWAKILRIHDCETYEQMRKLFREKYHSRIMGLVAMMRGAKRGDAAMAGAAADCDPEALDEVLQARDDGDLEWGEAAASKLEQFAEDVHSELGIEPEIILQTVNVNIRQWTEQLQVECKRSFALPFISTPHVFAIEKDPVTGDVFLYNKFLSQSHTASHSGEQHSYLNQLTGSYTTRALLYKEADRAQLNFDPWQHPAQRVDTKTLKHTFDAFSAQSAVTPDQRRELDAVLGGFDSAIQKQARSCDTCRAHVARLADIGVVSNKKDATADELAASKVKGRERTQEQTALRAHLKDRAFDEQHSQLRCQGWLTKWWRRVESSITPSFIARGAITDPSLKDLPYHAHPLNLCSGVDEPKVFAAQERVDLNWLVTHTAPSVGQLVMIVRTDVPREPFWIGKIMKLYEDSGDETAVEGAEGMAPEAAPAAAASSETLVRVPGSVHARLFGGSWEDALHKRFEDRLKKHGPCPVEVRMSRHVPTRVGEPTQLGVFATRKIKNGEFIADYGGCLTHHEDVRFEESSRTHMREVPFTGRVADGGPLAQLYTRYISSTEEGLEEMKALPSKAFAPCEGTLPPPVLARYLQLPVGAMMNSPAGPPGAQAKANAQAKQEQFPECGFGVYSALWANSDIELGGEVLCTYKNNEEKRLRIRQQLQREDSCSPVSMDIDGEDEDSSSEFRLDSDTDAPPARAAAAASSSPAAAAAASSNAHGGTRSGMRVTSAAPAAAAAAATRPAAATFSRAHHRDRRKVVQQLSSLPAVRVSWYDMLDVDVTKLRLLDDEYWDDLLAGESSAAAPGAAAAAAASSSRASTLRTEFAPVAPAVIDLFKDCRFFEKTTPQCNDLEPESFILWGADILTKEGTIKEANWQRLRLDLTESRKPAEARASKSSQHRAVQSAAKKSTTKQPRKTATKGNKRTMSPAVGAAAAAAAAPAAAPASKRQKKAAPAASPARSKDTTDFGDDLPLSTFEQPPAAAAQRGRGGRGGRGRGRGRGRR